MTARIRASDVSDLRMYWASEASWSGGAPNRARRTRYSRGVLRSGQVFLPRRTYGQDVRKSLRLVIVLSLALVAGVVPAGQAGAAGPLQPGDFIGTSVGGCTLGFAFRGTGALAGKTYFV